MLVFEFPKIISVYYEEENELIIHEWLEYNPEGKDDVIIEIMQKLYETFLAYPVKKVMVRANLVKGAFTPRVQRYIREVQVPRLVADTDMRYVVTIQSNERMSQTASKLWQLQFWEGSGVVLHNVTKEEDARAWLQSIE